MIELRVKSYGQAWAVFQGGKAVSAVCPSRDQAITSALALARRCWEGGDLARVSAADDLGEERQVAMFGDRRRTARKGQG